MNKVFVVGLSKTGTTSLHAALEQLGYRSIHNPVEMLSVRDGALVFATDLVQPYDALSDLVIAGYYRECDRAFPNSRFILTTRDEEKWIASCANHFDPSAFQPNQAARLLCERVYGTAAYDEAHFRTAFRSHNNGVREYFAGRPDEFLVIDIADPEKWAPLCRFLGVPEPSEPYPHENKASRVPTPIKNIVRRFQRRVRRATKNLTRPQ